MTNVLQVNGLGKCYVGYTSNIGRFSGWIGRPFGRKSEYWAVRDVSFSLAVGEALALIGENGAGKSTLLKLVTGTVRPTSGTIQVGGRVSAILELGLGLNPDLTGRQNIFLAGGLMGHSQSELAGLIPAIEDFAEVGEFFDQPLRVYSSGMQARLAFSLATAVRPDLLIVDEVLSVGDSYFQHKSFDRIRSFKEEGTSLLFVTHGMADVRSLCERVILLDHGSVAREGFADEVVDYYNAFISRKENAKLSIEQRRKRDGWLVTKSGTREVETVELSVMDPLTGQLLQTVAVDQAIRIRHVVRVNQDVDRLVHGIMIRLKEGTAVWGTNTFHHQMAVNNAASGERITYDYDLECQLGPGSYSISTALVSSDTHLIDNFEWTENQLIIDVVNVDYPIFAGTTHLNPTISISRST